MSSPRHLFYMMFTGAVMLGGLWVAGVPLARAAVWVLLLTCPLMMVAMLFMDHDQSHGGGHVGGSVDRDDATAGDDLRGIDAQYRR